MPSEKIRSIIAELRGRCARLGGCFLLGGAKGVAGDKAETTQVESLRANADKGYNNNDRPHEK